MFTAYFLLLLSLALINPLLGANILISPSWLNPVHRFTMRELAAELLKRNHSVTWLEYGLQPVCSAKLSDLSFIPKFSTKSVCPMALKNFIFVCRMCRKSRPSSTTGAMSNWLRQSKTGMNTFGNRQRRQAVGLPEWRCVKQFWPTKTIGKCLISWSSEILMLLWSAVLHQSPFPPKTNHF